MSLRRQRRSFMSVLGNLLGTNAKESKMTTYTLTEIQRQTLLEMTAFAYNACGDDWVQDEKITPAISLLEGLTPNNGKVAAPSTSTAEPVAYIQGTALFWPDCAPVGEPDCEPLYTTPLAAPSTGINGLTEAETDESMSVCGLSQQAAPSTSQPLTPHEIGAFVGTHEFGPEQLKWFRFGEAAQNIKGGA